MLPLLWAGATWFAAKAYAAFGVTTVGNSYRVDTNAGLVFEVSRYLQGRFLDRAGQTGANNKADAEALAT
jgi:hypothetical protein